MSHFLANKNTFSFAHKYQMMTRVTLIFLCNCFFDKISLTTSFFYVWQRFEISVLSVTSETFLSRIKFRVPKLQQR